MKILKRYLASFLSGGLLCPKCDSQRVPDRSNNWMCLICDVYKHSDPSILVDKIKDDSCSFECGAPSTYY